MTRRLFFLCIAGIAVIAVLTAIIVVPDVEADRVNDSAWSESGFCRPGREARDYLQPLMRMAPIRPVPTDGRLSFGPRGMRLEARGGRLSVNGGSVGFGLRDIAVGQTRNLAWIVSTRLSIVDAKGRVTRVVDERKRRIGSIDGNAIKDFVFQIPSTQRFYRTDISFEAAEGGRVLGEFSNYVRVVPAVFDSKLLSPGRVIHQGEVLPLRLANFGSETISSRAYDWRLAVEFFNGQAWVQAPSNPVPEKHILIVKKVPAGRMEPCAFVSIAENEAEGLYRASVVVDRSLAQSSERSVRLTTEFEVTGRGLR